MNIKFSQCGYCQARYARLRDGYVGVCNDDRNTVFTIELEKVQEGQCPWCFKPQEETAQVA